MGKIWTISVREYRAMVATKAFMISVTVMPILMFGSIVAMQYLRKFDSVEDRTIKVIDGTGMLFDGLAKEAKKRNDSMKSISEYVKATKDENKEDSQQGDEKKDPTDLSAENRLKKLRQSLQDRKLSNLNVELIAETPSPEVRLRLSNEIRKGDLYAFVEIPATVFDVPRQKPDDLPKLAKFLSDQGMNALVLLASPKFEMKNGKTYFVVGNKSIELPDEVQREFVEAGLKVRARMEPVAFYSENPSFSDERNWLESTIHGLIQSERLKRSNISELAVKRASIKSPFKGMALVSRSADGSIAPGKEVDRLTAIFLPFGMMMLMFMVIFLAAQPMLESVIEEKTERIAEVLLGCASPFQLMAGKLLGSVAGSLSILAIYMIGGFFILQSRGWTEHIPFHIVPWFLLFQVLAVLLYSSAFMSVGAAVTQTKEAQALLLPVWMIMMIPMFVWLNVIREPNGALATGISFFPPATPLMMILRMGTGATIPLWQYIATSILLVFATAFCLFVAGRIFRIGLLWQGKLPKIHELIRWAWKG